MHRLSRHVMKDMRANYQVGIFRGRLKQHLQFLSSVKHGWMRDDDVQLTVILMLQSPAHEAVLQLLVCRFNSKCSLPECLCSNGLICANMCKLESWVNQPHGNQRRIHYWQWNWGLIWRRSLSHLRHNQYFKYYVLKGRILYYLLYNRFCSIMPEKADFFLIWSIITLI